MFGPFRITNPLSGGLLWKIPWRLSRFQKRRHRLRLRAVDSVVATLDAALAKCLACDGPFFLDVQVAAQENCFPMMPSGQGHHRVMLAKDRWYEGG